jgi:glutamate-ammonia-ligase adenylyltransferase
MSDQQFSLREQLIEGNNDVLKIAQSYAHLAEETLVALTTAVVTEFEQTHGKIAGCELVIVALGSLGGEAMTHESDLDIVPLFTGNPLAESDGPQSLVATQYFNQLGEQVITALGAAYETVIGFQPWDTKDRFCTSVEGFDQYYREIACVAITVQYGRARVVFGSSDARTHVDTVIRDILLAQQNAENLRYRIALRREDIAVQRSAAEGVLDVKLLSGGLMDMIFIVHTLQLETQVGIKPQLTLAIDELVAAGHLTSDFADAYNMMMRLKMLVCILAPDYTVPSEEVQQLIVNRLEFDDWDGLMQALIQHRMVVIDKWQNMFDPALLRRH